MGTLPLYLFVSQLELLLQVLQKALNMLYHGLLPPDSNEHQSKDGVIVVLKRVVAMAEIAFQQLALEDLSNDNGEDL
jgi:hypothetical protein